MIRFLALALTTVILGCRSAPRAARPDETAAAAAVAAPDQAAAKAGNETAGAAGSPASAARPIPAANAPRAADNSPPASPAPFAARRIALVGDTAVLALPAPGFDALPREERLLAYWLARAGEAGDAIAYDQGYRRNLEIVRLLRGVLSHPAAVPRTILPRLRDFARRIYLNHGLHDLITERKVTPAFSAAELRAAALAAQATGADLGVPRGAPLEYHLRALDGPLFDPNVDAVRTSKSQGTDALLASAVNLYSGVSLRDLRGFKDAFPLNSRVEKDAAGRPLENVARAGGGGAAPGLYADRLARAAAALEQALPLARGAQARSLELLVGYLRLGEPERFRLSQRAWLTEAAPVDYVLGFVKTYADPRGLKALWEGFVGYQDTSRTAALGRLAASAQYFEDQEPWPGELKRTQVRTPAASALVVAAGWGDDRPQAFAGVNLPNEDKEREEWGSKSFLLPSLWEAEAPLRTSALLREFSPPELGDELVRCNPEHEFALAAFHEVVGHASGRASPRLGGRDPAEVLGDGYNTLEEARADLVAHWQAADARTVELGLLSPRCQELYPQYVTTRWFTYVASIARGDRVEEDHQRAAQLMIWWFRGKGAIAEQHRGGKRTLVVNDPVRWHAAAGELLTLLQVVKATGDVERLRELLGQHASQLDTEWRDEVVARISALGLPARVAALPPVLRPVLADGKVLDATAEPIADLDEQILRDWSSF